MYFSWAKPYANAMQTLYLMLGYPGAGKTTVAKLVHELCGAEHVWTAKYRRNWFGNPRYTDEENAKLYDKLNNHVAELLAKGKSVVFDTAFNYYRDREKLRKIADEHGAETVVVWVQTAPEIARDRAVDNAHHHISTRILGHMPAEKFEYLQAELEPPQKNEKYIKLDGTKITKEYVKQALGL